MEAGNRKKRGLPEAAEPYKFKPGQSGNPNGRPKGTSITKLMTEFLELAKKKGGKTQAAEVAQAIIDNAKKNPSFTNILLDRVEGTVVQKVAVGELESLPDEMDEGTKREIAAKQKRKEKRNVPD